MVIRQLKHADHREGYRGHEIQRPCARATHAETLRNMSAQRLSGRHCPCWAILIETFGDATGTSTRTGWPRSHDEVREPTSAESRVGPVVAFAAVTYGIRPAVNRFAGMKSPHSYSEYQFAGTWVAGLLAAVATFGNGYVIARRSPRTT